MFLILTVMVQHWAVIKLKEIQNIEYACTEELIANNNGFILKKENVKYQIPYTEPSCC